jgi:hypothetical protein
MKMLPLVAHTRWMNRRLSTLTLAAVVVFGLGLPACGDDASSGGGGSGEGAGGAGGAGQAGGNSCGSAVLSSCTQVDSDGAPTQCVEIFAAESQVFIDDCAAQAGSTVSASACDLTGANGACVLSIAGLECQRVWDYVAEPAELKTFCEDSGGEYVPVP